MKRMTGLVAAGGALILASAASATFTGLTATGTETTLSDGRWVSTVWLGLDHNYAVDGRPLIFETIVFDKDGPSGDAQDMWRWATEAEAIAGHDQIVASLRDGRDLAERPEFITLEEDIE